MNKTPFLSGFPTTLFGSAKRRLQAGLASGREAGGPGVADALGEEIPASIFERYEAGRRTRVYPLVVTFWAMLTQALREDASCAAAVAEVAAWRAGLGEPVASAGTSAYCQARARLPEDLLRDAGTAVSASLERERPGEALWRGHRVLAVDGTEVQMPDTAENRAAFPQPAGQEEGCGFPVARLVGLLDLCAGGWLEIAISARSSAENHGMARLLAHIRAGDVLVGDRLYCSYEQLAVLRGLGAHFVGRHHQARKVDFRRGRRLGPDERLVTWARPRRQPPGSTLDAEAWAALPETMEVRIIRARVHSREGGRETIYIATTLTGPATHPAAEVASINLHRWEIELRIRDIKSTMGMDMLRCRTPPMVRREILAHMVAYNALRLLMLRSAHAHGAAHRRIGFKGALQVVAASARRFAGTRGRPRLRARARDGMMAAIAAQETRERPGRNEPRRVKRRPKCTRWLQRPRREHPEHFKVDKPARKVLDETTTTALI